MNKTDKNILWVIGIFIAIVLVGTNLNLFTIIDSNHAALKWKGFDVKSSWSTGGSSSCSNWGASALPTDDTNGSISIRAYSNFGQCSGDGANSGLEVIIPNPKSYKSIFIKLSGNVNNGGYSGTSNCPSAGASGSLAQDSNSITLFSASSGCVGSVSNFPSGIVLNIDENFVYVPSV
ncbi:MAG: hypothetical protein AABY22_35220, partial [Nanoarchaeota archaeon]